MKILLDPQIFIYQKFGGISRYYTELYKAFKKKKGVDIYCPIIYTENLHLKEYSFLKNNWQKIVEVLVKLPFMNIEKIKTKSNEKSFSKTQNIIQKQQFNLFVPTYYNPYFIKHIGSKPFVLTVYDMIYELYPHCFSDAEIIIAGKKILIEKATKIIAISESTKRDILNLYPNIEASKIEIVYLGFTINFDSKINLSLPTNYILFVGNRQTYKNFIFFIRTVAPIIKKNADMYIVCAGGNSFSQIEFELINELEISKQIIQSNFKDNELATYYKNAKCFVFPSEYEGFGIPVLESMASGCPVVLANHSSFPEVAGEAGIYFELNNEIDLRNKIENLLNDKILRSQFILKGLAQAKKFSWEICAENIYKVYQSVA